MVDAIREKQGVIEGCMEIVLNLEQGALTERLYFPVEIKDFEEKIVHETDPPVEIPESAWQKATMVTPTEDTGDSVKTMRRSRCKGRELL